MRGLLFYHDFMHEGEDGVNIYADTTPKIDGKPNIISIVKRTPTKTFSAFLDGTMKLYKIGFAYFTGTPLYVAPTSVVLVVRDSSGRLYKSPYSVSFVVILFPFETYENFLSQKLSVRDATILIRDFIENLRVKLVNGGFKYIDGKEIEEKVNSRKEVFSASYYWILSDTSKIGILTKGMPAIQQNDLFNPKKVKEVARARARYFMGLAEFYCAYRYLQENEDSFLLLDGAFYPYRRVGRFFNITRDEYNKAMSRAVGFIKHPQSVPLENFGMISEIVYSNKFLVWNGYYDEKEVGLEKEEDNRKEIFQFVLIKFRDIGSFTSLANLVKLQVFNSTYDIEEVVNMVKYEQNPIPTDRRRIYTEAYPIQLTEEIAKANLPSEERIRGLVLSAIPPAL